ncbi:hypothetical protein NCAS_0B04600 [Naumovozyma castellii]|uniref:C2H2-type domain-containing protein n=1 Tax=Naumovozyma castellii TaxID=27288 RepID=G0VAL8_NAUCA|nr:hypothetical protein NCAS_0B04600 [Naumovozyma castellii CBS 4309]CCC68544.1 hypothetical protein NCAS_0B04600 [Naumovozyma castellii CBS 4309]
MLVDTSALQQVYSNDTISYTNPNYFNNSGNLSKTDLSMKNSSSASLTDPATIGNNNFTLQLVPNKQIADNITNNLTGDTVVNDSNNQLQPNNVFEDYLNLDPTMNSKRLSISDYNVNMDKTKYFEFEFFDGKTNKITNNNDDNNNNSNNSYMETLHKNFNSMGITVTETAPQPSIMNKMSMVSEKSDDFTNATSIVDPYAIDIRKLNSNISTNHDILLNGSNEYMNNNDDQDSTFNMMSFDDSDIDMSNDNIEFPLIGGESLQQSEVQPQPQQKKRVRDYFKLNIFSSSANINTSIDDVFHPLSKVSSSTSSTTAVTTTTTTGTPIFKKKYFWNRKSNPRKIVKSVKEEEAEIDDEFSFLEDAEDIITEETEINLLINPSKLVTSLGSPNGTSTVESMVSSPIDTATITTSSSELMISNNPFDVTSTTTNLTTPTSFLHLDSAENMKIRKDSTSSSHLHNESSTSSTHVIRKKLGNMPKTRGRKPSLLPDATKQFACDYCERRFKRQEHLKRHVRSLHIGEKPYACHICNKNFSRSDNLTQHIKTHG